MIALINPSLHADLQLLATINELGSNPSQSYIKIESRVFDSNGKILLHSRDEQQISIAGMAQQDLLPLISIYPQYSGENEDLTEVINHTYA